MSRRKLIAYTIILVLAFGLLAPFGYFFWTRVRGVYLGVTNNTSETIKHVELIYTGGVIRIAALQPKTSYGRRVNPISESSVTVKWIDSSGKEYAHVIDAYFERGYTGSLQMTVEPDGSISVVNKIRPYFF